VGSGYGTRIKHDWFAPLNDRYIRALVTRAGLGASGNLIRALRAMTPAPVIVGVNNDRFTIKASLADRNYVVPEPTSAGFVDAVLDIVERDRINLIIGADDDVVKVLSDARNRFPFDLFLPNRETIDLCQDKHALNIFFRDRDIPVPRFYEIGSLDDLEGIFARFEGDGVLWCRVRRGSGSLGATAVTNADQARSWITQWRDLRGIKVSDFTLGEYLPGRHYIATSVWHRGRLLLVQTTETLSYLAAGNSLTGTNSLSNLCKTVVAPEALRISLDAVRAIDACPSGAFEVEFKETLDGTPAIMEINAGRFPSGVATLLAACPTNMIEVFARASGGEIMAIPEPYGTAEELYLVHDVDCLPRVFATPALLDGL
jgi:biotin carboxylase